MDRRTFLANAIAGAAAVAMLARFSRAWGRACQPAAARRIGFLPSRHGFAFVNHFEGVPLPREIREGKTLMARLLREAAKGTLLPSTFGLCGGMSLAAADYYHANATPPPDTKPPKQGTPLYEYLYQRQTDSLGENFIMAAKFIEWMLLPDTGEGSCEQRSWSEQPGIRARLDAGEVVPIGLSLVRAKANTKSSAAVGLPWQNHQVLVYGSVAGPEFEDFRIYDPNHPHDDTVILHTSGPRVDPLRPRFSLSWKGGHSLVRGFFGMPHRPTPPWKPSPASSAPGRILGK